MDSEHSSESDGNEDALSPIAYAPGGSLCVDCSKLTNRSFRRKKKTTGYGLTIGQLSESRLQCRMCEFVYQTLHELTSGKINDGDSERRCMFRLVDERLASNEWPVIALAIDVEKSPGKGYYGPPTCGLRVAPATGECRILSMFGDGPSSLRGKMPKRP